MTRPDPPPGAAPPDPGRSPLAAGLEAFLAVALLALFLEYAVLRGPDRASQGAIAFPLALLAGLTQALRARRWNREHGAPWPWKAEAYGLVALGGAALPGLFGGAVVAPMVGGFGALDRFPGVLPASAAVATLAGGAALARAVVQYLRRSPPLSDPAAPGRLVGSFGRSGYVLGVIAGFLAGAALR